MHLQEMAYGCDTVFAEAVLELKAEVIRLN